MTKKIETKIVGKTCNHPGCSWKVKDKENWVQQVLRHKRMKHRELFPGQKIEEEHGRRPATV